MKRYPENPKLHPPTIVMAIIVVTLLDGCGEAAMSGKSGANSPFKESAPAGASPTQAGSSSDAIPGGSPSDAIPTPPFYLGLLGEPLAVFTTAQATDHGTVLLGEVTASPTAATDKSLQVGIEVLLHNIK